MKSATLYTICMCALWIVLYVCKLWSHFWWLILLETEGIGIARQRLLNCTIKSNRGPIRISLSFFFVLIIAVVNIITNSLSFVPSNFQKSTKLTYIWSKEKDTIFWIWHAVYIIYLFYISYSMAARKSYADFIEHLPPKICCHCIWQICLNSSPPWTCTQYERLSVCRVLRISANKKGENLWLLKWYGTRARTLHRRSVDSIPTMYVQIKCKPKNWMKKDLSIYTYI